MTSVRRTRQSRLSRMRWRVTGTKETHFAQRTTSNTNALFWGHELNVSLHPRKQRGLGPGRLGDGSFFFGARLSLCAGAKRHESLLEVGGGNFGRAVACCVCCIVFQRGSYGDSVRLFAVHTVGTIYLEASA